MKRYRIDFSYSGANYSGYQKQNNAKTIQGELEDALFSLYGQSVAVTASGRTDEGVHAYRQTAHYDVLSAVPLEKVRGALNYYLPPDIRILNVIEADKAFHARHGAKKKTYCYDMYFGEVENPLLYKKALLIDYPLNIDQMKAAAKCFEGKHDFTPFRAVGSDTKTTVRTVYSCSFTKTEIYKNEILRFNICADGFLYKMVRIILGTLLYAGQSKITIAEINEQLASKKEQPNKKTAPSHGLYLLNVEY